MVDRSCERRSRRVLQSDSEVSHQTENSARRFLTNRLQAFVGGKYASGYDQARGIVSYHYTEHTE